MNIPNILTMSRIVMAGALVYLLAGPFTGCYTTALVLFLLAGITDALDGYLARKVYGTTDFGKLMDPLADKIMVCAALVGFVGIRMTAEAGSLVPAWMVVLIISREFLITGLRLLAANKGKVISAGKWGKHKTIWQIVAISVVMLGLSIRYDFLGEAAPAKQIQITALLQHVSYGVMFFAVLITVLSGIIYMREHSDLLRG